MAAAEPTPKGHHAGTDVDFDGDGNVKLKIFAQNADEARLAEMGHTQQLRRHFSLASLVGLASTLTISWTGLGLGLVTSISAGGPAGVIYGFVLVALLQSFLAASLAEFVSAYPVAGGMYHWTAAVAPKRWRGVLSFVTGYASVFGWIMTAASTNLIWASNLLALVLLARPDLVLQPWMTFAAYQALNILTNAVVMYGNRAIPWLNRFSLVYLQLAYLTIMIVVAAKAPSHRSVKFVWATWINQTGWDNNFICFVTGLVNPLYSLGGLDGITHVAEEIPNASRNAPKAIFAAMVIAFITGLTYLIALMYSVQSLSDVSSTRLGLPLAEIFLQATSTRGGAFALVLLLFIAVGPCMVGSQLGMGRVFWAFARDGGLPFSRLWRKISSRWGTPLYAQMCCTAIVAALGCIYLGSSTAFNALMGTSVTVNNFAYLVPLAANLGTRRRNMHTGTFRMGHWGALINSITVAWLVFAIVFFSFPYYMPVTPQNMNYTCAVVGGFMLWVAVWWAVAGKRWDRDMHRKADGGAVTVVGFVGEHEA